jgi:hypothetical protein
MVQYTVTMLMLVHFLAAFDASPLVASAAYAAVILVSCVTIGGIMEGSRIAFAVEAVRLAVLAMALVGLPDWFGLSLPSAIRTAAVVSAAAAGIWLFALRRERRSAPATA